MFVCSDSWLDVGFGGKMQQFLLKNAHIQAIYDSALERQLASADVNTIISILRKERPADNAPTRFIRLNARFEQAVAEPHYQRVVERAAAEMWQSGLNEQRVSTKGDKWGGRYLRGQTSFTILNKAERYRV